MSLGELEEKILLAILHQGNDTYGAVVREVLAAAGRKVSVGALYVTFDRLETKGMIEGRESEVQTSRGGTARRFFRVTGKGQEALRENELIRANLQRMPNLAGGAA
jgi:DNA-binding PadR family transcriptional regulator